MILGDDGGGGGGFNENWTIFREGRRGYLFGSFILSVLLVSTFLSGFFKLVSVFLSTKR